MRRLAPLNLDVIVDFVDAVDDADGFLGELLLVVRADGPTKDDAPTIGFGTDVRMAVATEAVESDVNALEELGVERSVHGNLAAGGPPSGSRGGGGSGLDPGPLESCIGKLREICRAKLLAKPRRRQNHGWICRFCGQSRR